MWLLQVEKVILPWNNERLKIAIVIFIVPFVVNVSVPIVSRCVWMAWQSPFRSTGGDVLDCGQFADVEEAAVE